MAIRKLKVGITKIEDPRREWGSKWHALEEILIIALCPTICCGKDFVAMEELGRDREEWQQKINTMRSQPLVRASLP